MVRPAAFGFNAQTAATNRFQQQPLADGHSTAADPALAALAEFDAAASALRAAGAGVCVVADTPEPAKPDAVFPNNWVSFHEDGTVVLYPMHSPNRRLERREAVIDQVKARFAFVERSRLDLSGEERNGRFLEGTGSLVLDRQRRVAYACRSPRTDADLVREWSRLMDYDPVIFDARSPDGTAVYHTNVLLWIGQQACGCGLDWIDAAQREPVAARLRDGARDLLALDSGALNRFAGNMLEIHCAGGARRLAMSTSAAASLTPAQHARLHAAGCEPVVVAIPTIETLGGGSIRCMLAEVSQC